MADAVADGLEHVMVTRMSVVGQSQHAHQGFMDLIRRRTPILDDIRSIPDARGDAASHFLPPSAILRNIHRYYPEQFQRRLGADPELLRSFWSQLYNDRTRHSLSGHPLLRTLTQQELQYTIPLVLHEDAGPITKKSSANCISIAPLLGDGNEKLSHFLCTTYIKKTRAEGVDNTPMWRDLLADLEALFSGVVAGVTIAPLSHNSEQKWRFIVLFAKADEQVRCDDWGLPHYNAANEVCSECRANRTTKSWTDMRRCAAWRRTEVMNAADYKSRASIPRRPVVNCRL